MFQFSTRPPEDPRGNSLPLLRCPTNRPIRGIITTEQLFGCRTHFYHGRTLPCDDTNCPACDEGMPWRWHGYVGLFSVSTHRHVIFETTAKAAEPLTKYYQAYEGLRGCQLSAQRASTSPNSRVVITTAPADLEKISLPPAPNLLEALCIIWNIELPAIVVDGINKGNPALAINQNRDLTSDPLRERYRISAPDKPNGKVKSP